jgi:hypothetical protein
MLISLIDIHLRDNLALEYVKLSGCFIFLKFAPNDRGYGHWRFAGAFAVVERQGECGSKTAGIHVNKPMNIGVC